ncbi:MAG: zf-HC2 domain-containing protein [Anaeromyxobacteraceae bacterium]
MKHVVEDLTALADGALPEERAREVRAHLAGCAACRAEEARLTAALSLLSRLPAAPEPSPYFGTRLAAAIAEEERRPRGLVARLSMRWRLAIPAGAVAAAGLAAFLGIRAQRAEERAIAEHLELLSDYEVVASLDTVETEEDADVVAHLDELSPKEGRP